jgi:hypothetical protein
VSWGVAERLLEIVPNCPVFGSIVLDLEREIARLIIDSDAVRVSSIAFSSNWNLLTGSPM